MATVTSLESLAQPTKSDLRQFAELFRPLYENSSDDARRQAVAALARCPVLPTAVCFFIGSQPIAVAAIFLSQSKAVSDQTLIDIARSQGKEHAHAIAMRDDLSPAVVDVLAALHDGAGYRNRKPNMSEPATMASESYIASEPQSDSSKEQARHAREEALRDDLRHLVSLNDPEALPPEILKGVAPLTEALMVRFARTRQTLLFARALTNALGSSASLSNRILLDLSGIQLATTLIALGVNAKDIRFILCRMYPHLAQAVEGRTRAHVIVRSLNPADCVSRVASWRRADHYTETGEFSADAANEDMPFEKTTGDGLLRA